MRTVYGKNILEEAEGAAVLFSKESEETLLLNETAVIIFKDIEKKMKKEQIVEHLKAIFPEVEYEILNNDCMEFLDQMNSFGLSINCM